MILSLMVHLFKTYSSRRKPFFRSAIWGRIGLWVFPLIMRQSFIIFSSYLLNDKLNPSWSNCIFPLKTYAFKSLLLFPWFYPWMIFFFFLMDRVKKKKSTRKKNHKRYVSEAERKWKKNETKLAFYSSFFDQKRYLEFFRSGKNLPEERIHEKVIRNLL